MTALVSGDEEPQPQRNKYRVAQGAIVQPGTACPTKAKRSNSPRIRPPGFVAAGAIEEASKPAAPNANEGALAKTLEVVAPAAGLFLTHPEPGGGLTVGPGLIAPPIYATGPRGPFSITRLSSALTSKLTICAP
jgi:hypothetical protein